MGFTSVVLVGHDDGGLLALKAVQRLQSSTDFVNVKIKGIVLLGVNLSRELVPTFAKVLLHTSLGKKHLVCPLLRREITQLVNRRAWYDATKLQTKVLRLYKVLVLILEMLSVLIFCLIDKKHLNLLSINFISTFCVF